MADRNGTIVADRHASGWGRQRGGATADGTRRTQPRHRVHTREPPVGASAPDTAGKATAAGASRTHRRWGTPCGRDAARTRAARTRDADGTAAREAAAAAAATAGTVVEPMAGAMATAVAAAPRPREPYGHPRGGSGGDKDVVGVGGGGSWPAGMHGGREAPADVRWGACHRSSAGTVQRHPKSGHGVSSLLVGCRALSEINLTSYW